MDLIIKTTPSSSSSSSTSSSTSTSRKNNVVKKQSLTTMTPLYDNDNTSPAAVSVEVCDRHHRHRERGGSGFLRERVGAGSSDMDIEDSKKNLNRKKNRRGKTIEPSKEEISRTRNKRGLLGWYKKCNELKVYLKNHGHCNVPQKDTKSKQLGSWVKYQRQEMKNFESEFGLKTSMTSEKIEHLEDMGFQWSVKKECEDTMWNQRYEELLYFKEKHGHCRIPQRTSGKLGLWVRSMRSTARRPKCNEKMEKLKAVGLFDS